MKTDSFTFDETAWQFACDKSNAAAKMVFDAAEQSALAKDKTHVVQIFVPKTVSEYVQAILDGCGKSYGDQQRDELIAAALADPEQVARLAKLLSQPKPVINQFAAQVDALPS